VAIYAWLFIYPTVQMVLLTFTNAPLIGAGEWTGLRNYERLLEDRTFIRSIWNTFYFVLLTVVPGTAVALIIAMMVHRLKGWLQSAILAAFFLPFILPVSVVYLIWQWIFDPTFGIAQHFFTATYGESIPVFRRPEWFLPMVGLVTVWWTNGFSILLFLAGLKAIPPEIYESAALDNANRWRVFWRITWPLIWPVTALVATIQLILQLKIFDQVYLFSLGGRTAPTMVMLQYVYEQAFVQNRGGYGATVALALFVFIVVVSVLQFTALRARGAR
jgi:multiple sugar transport system permease protein